MYDTMKTCVLVWMVCVMMAAGNRCKEVCKEYRDAYKYDIDKIYDKDVHFSYMYGTNKVEVYINMCRTLDTKLLEREIRDRYNSQYGNSASNMVVGVYQNEKLTTVYSKRFDNSTAYRSKVYSNSSELDNEVEYRRIPRSNISSIILSYEDLDNRMKDDSGIRKVVFVNTCYKDSSIDFYDQYFIKDLNTLVVLYKGGRSCGVMVPNYIYFLSQNIPFLLILFLTSLVGIFIGRDNERLSMSLSSVQASIMIFTSICVYATKWVDLTSQSSFDTFSLICFLSSSVALSLSYFNRKVSLTFVCIATSYSIVWSTTYLYILIFKINVPFINFIIGNILVCAVIVIISVYSRKAREKYSYVIYTALTNSFYLCLAVFIWTKSYLDIISFNAYTKYGKYDDITYKHWLFPIIQIVLTCVLLIKQERYARKMVRENKDKITNTLTERIIKNDNDVYEGKNENETLIAM